jgi:hypothetical protein
MKIYRIEYRSQEESYKYGFGPYYNDDRKNIRDTRLRPAPWDDLLKGQSYSDVNMATGSMKYHFGFRNRKDLIKWFQKKNIKRLAKIGYHVVRFTIDEKHCIVLRRQVMFKNKKEKEIYSRTLTYVLR